MFCFFSLNYKNVINTKDHVEAQTFTCTWSKLDVQQQYSLFVYTDTGSSYLRDTFLAEMSLLISLGPHEHIVGLIGVCTKKSADEENSSLLLVTEYMAYGDLLHFLWDAREVSVLVNQIAFGATTFSMKIHSLMSFVVNLQPFFIILNPTYAFHIEKLELKLQAPAPSPGIQFFWLRLQHLEVFGSGSRTIWSIEN